jgi:citrate lyase beta subunit
VDRIGLDLERQGKRARQRGRGTWISDHRVESLCAVRTALRNAELFARTEPLHARTRQEVELLIDQGVRVLMLPMFESAREVELLLELVAGRARVVPLLETRAAAADIERLVALSGLDELHIGINDLSLSLGVANRFAVLFSSLVGDVCRTAEAAGLRIGIGAIGRFDDRSLPVEPDLVYARYVALGATGALLARSYAARATDAAELAGLIATSRERIDWWRRRPPAELADAGAALQRSLARVTVW